MRLQTVSAKSVCIACVIAVKSIVKRTLREMATAISRCSPNRLFTVEQSVIPYTAAKPKAAKLGQGRSKIRELFA